MYIVILLITLLAFTPAALAADQRPVLQETTPITAGAVMKNYHWETADGPAKIHVVEIDLNNPYVQLGVIPGAGKLTQRLNVSAMAKNTGAVAAINGDFYNTRAEGSPIGPTVIDRRWVTSPSKLEGIYALGITGDRMAHIEPFTFEGKVTAPNGKELELAGLNKTIYWEEPHGAHSHAHKLHLYNDMWGGKTRGNDSYTIPTEMLVDQGRVVSIVKGQYIDSPVPQGMYILRGHGLAAGFLLDNFKPGDPADITYACQPQRDWSMVIGGHALLVDLGAAVPYTKDISALGGVRARTAAGISRDGKKLWLVGVEGRTAASKGLTPGNLSRFLVEIGTWRALNLDGGGSSTMVARPLGEWETRRVFTPEQTTERLVVNALGVFTSAPEGSLKGLALPGVDLLLVNEQVPLNLRAYDEYYNPVDVSALPVEWQISGGTGKVEGGVFVAGNPGQFEIRAGAGSMSSAVTAKVLGKTDVAAMKLTGNVGQVLNGEQIPLSLTLTTTSGKTRQVPASLADWQFYGLEGAVSPEGVLTVQSGSGQEAAFVVARYQGFSAPLPVKAGNEPAAPSGLSMELTVGQKQMLVNGTVWEMDVAPVIMDGRTLVPVRFISQAMNAPVLWEGAAKNATVVRGGNWIDLWLGERLMVVDGQAVELDVPPLALQGRTMLPLGAVARAMGLTVDWDPGTKKIYLN
ncbi:MAG: stalk domain-containing protein [Bacillota bacterium]